MNKFEDYVNRLTEEETIELLRVVLDEAPATEAYAAIKQWIEDMSLVERIKAEWD